VRDPTVIVVRLNSLGPEIEMVAPENFV